MADLASTRVFGKLTVMHDAILKANAEMVGNRPQLTLETSVNEVDGGGRVLFKDSAGGAQSVQLRYSWHNSESNPYGLIIEEGPGNSASTGANLHITGRYYGNGSGLTGTAALRAMGTTKGDVGLGNVGNYSPSVGAAGNTYALRDSSGDINARLFTSTFASTNSSIAGIYTTRTIGGDYMRPSTPGQVKNAIGLGNVDNKSQADYDNRYLLKGQKSVDSDKLDGINSSQFIRSDVNDTVTGEINFRDSLKVSGGSPSIKLTDDSTGEDDFLVHVNSSRFYILTDRNDDGSWETPHALELNNSNSTGQVYGSLIWTEANSDSFNNTGTYSGLRAQATTKGDVGLGSVDNYSRSHYDGRYAPKSHGHDGSDINANNLYWGGRDHKLFNNDGSGNAGISFGADVDNATESGRPWRIRVDNDSATGNFTIMKSLSGINAGDPINWEDSLQLDSSGVARFNGGQVTLGGSGTIASSNWAAGAFHLGDSISGWAMDDNELFNSGQGIIGTLSGDLRLTPEGRVVSSKEISAPSFSGDGSSLTGNSSMRATGTTKADVGLSRVNNVGLNWSWRENPTHIWGSEGDSGESYVFTPESIKNAMTLSKVDVGLGAVPNIDFRDYGLGVSSLGTLYNNSTDNTDTPTGIYKTDGNTTGSLPAGQNHNGRINHINQDPSTKYQTYQSVLSDDIFYRRYRNGWSNWFKLLSTNNSDVFNDSYTYSNLRAQRTTKGDVGLSNIPNSISSSRDHNSASTLVTSNGMYNHKRSGDHDDRYFRKEGNTSVSVTGDWNDVVTGGFYQGDGLLNESPGGSWRFCMVQRHNSSYVVQTMMPFSGNDVYHRSLDNGVWSNWQKVLFSDGDGSDLTGITSSSTTFANQGVRTTDNPSFKSIRLSNQEITSEIWADGETFVDLSHGLYTYFSSKARLNWNSGNVRTGFGVDLTYDQYDSPLLSVDAHSSPTADKVVSRNESGDIEARLFRSNFNSLNAEVNYIYTTRNSSGDYIRPSTPTQVKASMGFGNAADANISKSRDSSTSSTVVTSEGMYDHKRSGDHDSRYYTKNEGNGRYAPKFPTYNGINAFVLARIETSVTLNGGDTIAGNDLSLTTARGNRNTTTHHLTGTWQCMGFAEDSNYASDGVTVFMRIA